MINDASTDTSPAQTSLADLQNVDPSQLTPAQPAIDTGRPGLNFLNQWAAQIRQEKVAQARSQVVQQAIQQYKNGDTKGAFATMGMVQPEAFQKTVAAEATAQPTAFGKTSGELAAQSQYSSTPGQIESQKAEAQVKSAGIKTEKPVIRKDNNSPTGFSMITPQGVVPFDAYGSGKPNQKNKDPGSVQALRPNEVFDPESKQKILLAPIQVTHLDTGIKNFDSDTKEINKALEEATLGSDLVKKNIPGMGVVEKLRALKSAVGNGRVAVQEVQAMGGKEGINTAIENAISEASGKGMGPTSQQNMLKLLDAAQNFQLDEFNQKLHMHIQRIANSTNLPVGVVLSRLAPSLPTVIQQRTQDLAQNGTAEDKAAVEWAHNALLTKKRTDPEWKKALQILQIHGL